MACGIMATGGCCRQSARRCHESLPAWRGEAFENAAAAVLGMNGSGITVWNQAINFEIKPGGGLRSLAGARSGGMWPIRKENS